MRLCKCWNAHRHGRTGQADTRDRGRLSKKWHISYRLSSDVNGASLSDAKWHPPHSTPRSQLPTYISICQLSSSCSVPGKSPGFSLLSVIMLNCWDQLLLTLELPDPPLLFLYFFPPLLLTNLNQRSPQHQHDPFQQDTGVTDSLSGLAPNGELRLFITETARRDTESSHHLPKRSYWLHIFKRCLK